MVDLPVDPIALLAELQRLAKKESALSLEYETERDPKSCDEILDKMNASSDSIAALVQHLASLPGIGDGNDRLVGAARGLIMGLPPATEQLTPISEADPDPIEQSISAAWSDLKVIALGLFLAACIFGAGYLTAWLSYPA